MQPDRPAARRARVQNWRRSLDRTQKQQMVAALHDVFSSTHLVVVTRPSGLTVAESTDLRRRMRGAGASFKVTKNRLTRLALKDTSFAPLAELFVGPTAIAFSDDPVAAAKVAVEFAEKNVKLDVLGGALDGVVLDVAAVTSLARLPSLDELRSRLIAMIQTPATRIAGVVQAPAGQLARVLNAYATKDQAA
jgi:large subunit ribosomal protein L10